MGKKEIIEILYNYKEEFSKLDLFHVFSNPSVSFKLIRPFEKPAMKYSFHPWCLNRRNKLQIWK